MRNYGDSARYKLSAVSDSTEPCGRELRVERLVAGCLLSQVFSSQCRNVFGFFLPAPLAAAVGINLTFFP